MRRAIFFGGVVLTVCVLAHVAWAQARPNPRNVGVVLRTAAAPRNTNADYSSGAPEFTIWRYYEVWATDVARTDDGKLVRVDPYNPRSGFEPAKLWREHNSGRNAKEMRFPLQPAEKISASAPPPADWMKAGFDDSSWVRTAYPMSMHYRAIAQQCLRGKFEVGDPAGVKELTLTATVQGGAVFYLNGQEIGRVGLAAGEIRADTLAEDYPKEAFIHPNGTLLLPQVNTQLWILPQEEYAKTHKDPALGERYARRFRPIKLMIPGKSLVKGTNVLAIDVRRAPANPAMFEIISTKEMGYNLADQRNWWWNRCELNTLSLMADPPTAAVTGRVGRPKGIEVWNWPVSARVDLKVWGDSGEKLSPIRMAGARNGAFHGQVVVSANGSIANLKASVSDIKGPGGASIPPAAVTLRYAQFDTKRAGVAYDALEDSAPAVIEPPKMRYGPEGAAQPLWLSVAVPADAKAGDYTGTLSVLADGLPETKVPVELHVADYVLPDAKDFKTHIGFVQSPETLAIRYGSPMWSEDHWKLIEKSFAVLASVATKEITIPLLRKTHFGNEHAMLYWVKQADGSMKPDFTIIVSDPSLDFGKINSVPKAR